RIESGAAHAISRWDRRFQPRLHRDTPVLALLIKDHPPVVGNAPECQLSLDPLCLPCLVRALEAGRTGRFRCAGVEKLRVRLEIALPIAPPGPDLRLVAGIHTTCRVHTGSI